MSVLNTSIFVTVIENWSTLGHVVVRLRREKVREIHQHHKNLGREEDPEKLVLVLRQQILPSQPMKHQLPI